VYLNPIKEVCARLGFPLKIEKIEGPTWVITFLGIILDSTTDWLLQTLNGSTSLFQPTETRLANIVAGLNLGKLPQEFHALPATP
jgi:hypothetical protein